MKNNLKKELIRLGSTNPDLQKHIAPIIAGIEKQSSNTDWAALWNKHYKRGKRIAPTGHDINRLRGHGRLIEEAYGDFDVAVYENNDGYVLVGDPQYPWGVELSHGEV